VVTAIVMLALLDRSCHPRTDTPLRAVSIPRTAVGR
jgi:hypothetical protein